MAGTVEDRGLSASSGPSIQTGHQLQLEEPRDGSLGQGNDCIRMQKKHGIRLKVLLVVLLKHSLLPATRQ